jgi:alpha-tubulin suppressor-like RCC1 family protein
MARNGTVPAGDRVVDVRASYSYLFVQLEGGLWRAGARNPIEWATASQTEGAANEPLTRAYTFEQLPDGWPVIDAYFPYHSEQLSKLRHTNVTVKQASDAYYLDILLLSNDTILPLESTYQNYDYYDDLRGGTDLRMQPPADIQGETDSFACGQLNCIALLKDGTAVSWGSDNPSATAPPPLPRGRRFTAVAMGASHSLFLRDDGVVTQLGWLIAFGPPVPLAAASQPIAAFAAGFGVAVALTQSGDVISWGLAGYAVADSKVPSAVRAATIQSVAAGSLFALALSTRGEVHHWGALIAGRAVQVPVPEAARTDVSTIDAGPAHALAVRTDGSVVVWGADTGSELASSTVCFGGSRQERTAVVRLPWLVGANITAVSVGPDHAVALLGNGSVVQWGCQSNRYQGQLTVPANVTSGVVEVAAGNGYAMALTAFNKLVVWGGSKAVANTPDYLHGPDALPVTAISASVNYGYSYALAVLANGTVVTWGEGITSTAVYEPGDGSAAGRTIGAAAGSTFQLALVEPASPPPQSPPGKWVATIVQQSGSWENIWQRRGLNIASGCLVKQKG